MRMLGVVRSVRGSSAGAKLSVLAAAVGLVALSVVPALAVNPRVKSACQDDYFKFCPSYAEDTPQLRQCMRQAGKRLSQRCIDALVDAGEIRRTAKK